MKKETSFELSKKDFTPFLDMSDSNFQKVIDSKFLETDLVNHILNKQPRRILRFDSLNESSEYSKLEKENKL